ncbi:hypothetical protein GGR57DRAFT_463716 [Xylariaceae sp. FL1272]|nr:hypothetical protein GGR57DRAFT_463716 [Xylariaceae sp. FL1272]
MPPPTPDVFNILEMWLEVTLCIVWVLAMIYAPLFTATSLLDIHIERGPLRWSFWEAVLHALCLWLLLALFGLCVELIFFVGWLCLTRIRGQQIETSQYKPLGARAI